MEQEHRRTLAHPGSVRDELGPVDVEVEPCVADRNPHRARLTAPGIRIPELEPHRDDHERSCRRRGARRLGSGRQARRARPPRDRPRSGARPALRSRPRDRRGCAHRGAGPVDRARERRDAARRARSAHAPLRPPPAADVHAGARRRAARRRVRGDHGRERRGAGGRPLARAHARARSRSRSPTRSATPTTRARRSRRTIS